MKTLRGRDTVNWNFEEWTRFIDEQDRNIAVLMRKDLELINEIGPDRKEVEGHYLDEGASVRSVPLFLTAVRFMFAAKQYEGENTPGEIVGHAAYATYQIIRAHEVGYDDDRMMGTTIRIWRAYEVAKKVGAILWKKRSAAGASLDIIRLHALAERLEHECAVWHGFLCEEHDFDPLLKLGPRRFLGSLVRQGFALLREKSVKLMALLL